MISVHRHARRTQDAAHSDGSMWNSSQRESKRRRRRRRRGEGEREGKFERYQ